MFENTDKNNDFEILKKWLELNENTIKDHIDDNNSLKQGIACQHSPKKSAIDKREESKQLFSEECL